MTIRTIAPKFQNAMLIWNQMVRSGRSSSEALAVASEETGVSSHSLELKLDETLGGIDNYCDMIAQEIRNKAEYEELENIFVQRAKFVKNDVLMIVESAYRNCTPGFIPFPWYSVRNYVNNNGLDARLVAVAYEALRSHEALMRTKGDA
jgi:hypothetical protein